MTIRENLAASDIIRMICREITSGYTSSGQPLTDEGRIARLHIELPFWVMKLKEPGRCPCCGTLIEPTPEQIAR